MTDEGFGRTAITSPAPVAEDIGEIAVLQDTGDLEGILAASSRKDSPVSGGVRSKLGAAIDYLAVAPTVVAVARDLDLGVGWDALTLPATPAHPRCSTGTRRWRSAITSGRAASASPRPWTRRSAAWALTGRLRAS